MLCSEFRGAGWGPRRGARTIRLGVADARSAGRMAALCRSRTKALRVCDLNAGARRAGPAGGDLRAGGAFQFRNDPEIWIWFPVACRRRQAVFGVGKTAAGRPPGTSSLAARRTRPRDPDRASARERFSEDGGRPRAEEYGIDTSEIRAARIGVRGGDDLAWIGRTANYVAKLTSCRSDYQTWLT